MSDVEYGNLDRIASGLGYKNKGGEASWRIMLRALARGELVVSRPKSQHVFDAKNYPNPVSVIQAGPLIPDSVPAWNAPVAKVEFVTEREDGTFVDTEEFDKPVPQKKVPAAVEAFAGIFGMKAEVSPIPQYANKEEKLAALAKLGLVKGSQLT